MKQYTYTDDGQEFKDKALLSIGYYIRDYLLDYTYVVEDKAFILELDKHIHKPDTTFKLEVLDRDNLRVTLRMFSKLRKTFINHVVEVDTKLVDDLSIFTDQVLCGLWANKPKMLKNIRGELFSDVMKIQNTFS